MKMDNDDDNDMWCEFLESVGTLPAMTQEQFEQEQAAALAATKRLKPPPYPEFCHHSEICAGLACCPRDPNCCD